jgi:hypothetical protein
MVKWINKQELKFIALASAFLLVFFLFIIPTFYSPDIPFWLAFIIFNLSVLLFMQFFLKSIVTKEKKTLKGAVGIMFLILGFSIISPPLSINVQGIANTGMFLGNASADFFVSNLYSVIGATGFLLYFLTYIFSSIICFILSAIFIKNFLEEV